MNEMAVFSFNGQGQVRTIVDIDGNPLFCGKDVCEILGYANASDAIKQHCKGVAKRYPLQTAGGVQDIRFLTEPDLYRLIVSSQLPAAQAFEAWIFEEVLPTIRKTGQYTHPTAPSLPLVGERLNIERFKVWHEFAELCGLKNNAALISADNTMRREYNVSMLKTAQIELKNPEQEFLLTPTQIAGRLKLSGPREVNLLLALKGFQTRENKQWLPTTKGQAFAVLLDTGKRHSSGVMIQQVKWKESVLNELDIEEQ